ncbi:MAG: GIY-YIG nuclease family protein [Oculatellaceae cyanobacterium bins.114]|nr:GIY-YIG nuclease family protein [Oculatellaceae cyanobacterium bins.114]
MPECSAIYFAIARDYVLYVGQATNLRNRWQGNHHRLPQLEAINRRYEVKLFWLSCNQNQLNDLERQYIDYYCPALNQTKIPKRKLIPSFQMFKVSLTKLNERVIGFGICPSNEQQLKKVVLGYLSASTETRAVTGVVRKSLQAINRKPNSLIRWVEVVRGPSEAFWRTRCNGIEVLLIPLFGERLMHNPSMYEVVTENRFGTQTSIPMPEYDAMRQAVKAMSFKERLELARNSQIGWSRFPLECGASFQTVSGVEILCLTSKQLEALFAQRPYFQNLYPGIQAITNDPIPSLLF